MSYPPAHEDGATFIDEDGDETPMPRCQCGDLVDPSDPWDVDFHSCCLPIP